MSDGKVEKPKTRAFNARVIALIKNGKINTSNIRVNTIVEAGKLSPYDETKLSPKEADILIPVQAALELVEEKKKMEEKAVADAAAAPENEEKRVAAERAKKELTIAAQNAVAAKKEAESSASGLGGRAFFEVLRVIGLCFGGRGGRRLHSTHTRKHKRKYRRTYRRTYRR